MVAHVDISEFIYQANQMTFLNLTTCIFGRQNLPRLLVMKNRLLRCFSVGGIGDGPEYFVVIVHIWICVKLIKRFVVVNLGCSI